MNILANRGKSIWKECFVPGQGTIYTIGNCPTTVDSHIAIAQFVETQINKSFGIRFDYCFVRGACVVIVSIPSGLMLDIHIKGAFKKVAHTPLVVF